MDGAVGVVVRAAQRGDPAVSIRRYVASLPDSDISALLSPTTLTPDLLRALWAAHAPVLHTRLLPAAAAAAGHAGVCAADALLTEAEALLASDAKNVAVDAHLRMRALTTACTQLLRCLECDTVDDENSQAHVPRMVVACARVAAGFGQCVGGHVVADRICGTLLNRVADAIARLRVKATAADGGPGRSSHIGGAILALLDCADSGRGRILSTAVAGELRRVTCDFTEVASARDAQDIPAILKAVLAFCSSGADSAASLHWAMVARFMLQTAPVAVFSDLLCVVEWKIGEAPVTAKYLLLCYEHFHAEGFRKATARDVAFLLAVVRSDCDRVRASAMRMIASFIVRPLDLLDTCSVAASSSSVESPAVLALNSALLGSLALPGIDLRCAAVVGLGEWLLQACVSDDRGSSSREKDESLRAWGVKLLVGLFVRHDASRLSVLDATFASLAEDACNFRVRSLFCDVLDHVARHETASVMFRPYVARIKHWLGYLSSMPAVVAIRVVTVLAPLAVSIYSFRDFFTVMLRKLSCTRSSNARGIATAGLVALLVNPDLDSESADDAVALVCTLFESGSLRVRAVLLSQLSLKLKSLDAAFLRDRRFEPLHRAVASRIASLTQDYHRQLLLEQIQPCNEVCPVQLNACFEVVVGEPELRDAVPELLQYIIALRRVNAEVNMLVEAVVSYVSNVGRAVRDAAQPHDRHSLNPKWVYVKSRLLIYICELLLDMETADGDNVNIAFVLQAYAAALTIRDGVASKLRPAPSAAPSLILIPASACLNQVFAGADWSGPADQMTAREASALAFTACRGDSWNVGISSGCGGSDDIDRSAKTLLNLSRLTGVLQEVHTLFFNEKRSALVVSCELAAALLSAVQNEATTSQSRMSALARSRVVPIAVHIFCATHPWLDGNASRNEEHEIENDDNDEFLKPLVPTCRGPTDLQFGDMSMVTSDEIGSDDQNQRKRYASEQCCQESFFAHAARGAMDTDARAALDRMHATRDAFDRHRVTLRFYALEILRILPLSTLDMNSAIWDYFVLEGKVDDGDSLVPHASFQLSRQEQIVHALLRCLEREFSFSMSTSLSVCYAQMLTRFVRGASVAPAVTACVSQCVARVLREYSITHPRVLRPMLALLLDALKWDDAMLFLRSLFSWLFEERVVTGNEEEEDTEREGLNFDVNPADFPGENSADDGDKEVENSQDDVDSIHGDLTNVGTENVSTENERADGQGKGEKCVPLAGIDVRLLSLAETRECRVASLLTCVAFLESGLRSVNTELSSSNASIVSDVSTLLSTSVLPHTLPPAVSTRVQALLTSLLMVARESAKALRRAATSGNDPKTSDVCCANAVGRILTAVLGLRSLAGREGRLRYLWEQVLVETSAVIAVRGNAATREVLAGIAAAMPGIGKGSDARLDGAIDGDGAHEDGDAYNEPLARAVRRKRRRVRSRNRAVDSLLDDEYGDDDGADMEGFLVGMDDEL
jgi:FANCI solenoid 2